jgi:lipopolysaccharide assembly outer membrane protein LptD (OstA)
MGSGWTYSIKTDEYFNRDVGTYDCWQIPLLLQLEYPVLRTVSIQGRVKFNLNTQQRSTYSSGFGISLQL